MSNQTNQLSQGERLQQGQRLFSQPNELHELIMQNDGNLVVYERGGKALWASNTLGLGSELVMQTDGNLCLYGSKGCAWTTNTLGSNGARRLVIHDDGNLCLYNDKGTVVWSTNTVNPIKQFEVKEIVYDREKARIENSHVKGVTSQIVDNSTVSSEVSPTVTLKGTISETREWSNTIGTELTFSESLSVGVPNVAEAEVEISVTGSASHTWNKSITEEKEWSCEVNVKVPPHARVRCSAVVTKSDITLPYYLVGMATFASGSCVKAKIAGTYYGSDSYDLTVRCFDISAEQVSSKPFAEVLQVSKS